MAKLNEEKLFVYALDVLCEINNYEDIDKAAYLEACINLEDTIENEAKREQMSKKLRFYFSQKGLLKFVDLVGKGPECGYKILREESVEHYFIHNEICDDCKKHVKNIGEQLGFGRSLILEYINRLKQYQPQ